MSIKEYNAAVTIRIDYDRCTGSGECAVLCPVDVFEIVAGKSTVPNIAACVECCACAESCPTGAIKHSSCK